MAVNTEANPIVTTDKVAALNSSVSPYGLNRGLLYDFEMEAPIALKPILRHFMGFWEHFKKTFKIFQKVDLEI